MGRRVDPSESQVRMCCSAAHSQDLRETFSPASPCEPQAEEQEKADGLAPEKGKCPAAAGAAKEMGLGKILKYRRSHFRAQLVHFGLFCVCLSQGVGHQARGPGSPKLQVERVPCLRKAVQDSMHRLRSPAPGFAPFFYWGTLSKI